MWKITIDAAKCQGDGDCVDACPIMILSVTQVDDKKMAVVSGKEEDCLGCMACTTVCATDSLAVFEV